MAAMAVDPPAQGAASSTSTTTASQLSIPSRNPLPLSVSQEAQVRDVFHERVRRYCADEIRGPSDVFPFRRCCCCCCQRCFPISLAHPRSLSVCHGLKSQS